MKTNIKHISFGIVCSIIASTSLSFSEDNTSLISSYLGDGIFKYEMIVHKDPYFSKENNGFAIGFTNLTEVIEYSSAWVLSTNSGYVSLEYPIPSSAIPRPYSVYCILKSSNTNYCTLNLGACIAGDLVSADDLFGSPYTSGNIVFYSCMDAIVPCPDNNTNNSPISLRQEFEMFPDIMIDEIILENGSPMGITFSPAGNCTLLFQASTNLHNWIDVGYLLGSTPSTSWISEHRLDTYGNFYRLLLASNRQRPELIEGTSQLSSFTSVAEAPASPKFTIKNASNGKVAINIDTLPEARYVISFGKYESEYPSPSFQFVAEGTNKTIQLNLSDLPPSATISVSEYNQ